MLNPPISYMKLLRWLRETHVIAKHEIIELPVFRSTNQLLRIYFKRISNTGFHQIDKVVDISRNEYPVVMTELDVNLLLEKEATFRVAAYTDKSDKDCHTVSQEKHLLSIENCYLTENSLINNKLYTISVEAKNTEHETELIEKLRKELQSADTQLANLYLESNFLPGVSDFFPMLDGIGNLDCVPFYEIPSVAGGEQKGRIWLNNPFNLEINKDIIPSLDFFDVFQLADGWEMKDAQLEDLPLIHGWMNGPILAPTFRQNYSLEQWKHELDGLIESPFTRPMILFYQKEASAYLEFYRPAGVKMGESFWFDPTEMGYHLGLVKPELINKKFGRRMMAEIVEHLMKFPKHLVGGLVGEPDVNNLRMFKAALNTGVVYHVSSIALPHKCSHVVRYDRNFDCKR